MTLRKKILESKCIIRFQDCDPFNHLNNAKYVDYFLNAREDHLIANYGLNIYQIAKTDGVSWVVTTNQIAYLKPATLMEVVAIESQLIEFSDKSLTVEMRMMDHQKKELKSFMWIQFTHINMQSKKSENHAAKYLSLFKDVLEPVEEKTFEQRGLAFMKSEKVIKTD